MDGLFAILGYDCLDAFVSRIEEMMEAIKLPTRLSALNIKESDLKKIAEVSMKAPAIHFTPVKVDEGILYHLLKSIL